MVKRFAQRHARLAERGSQSLEWVALAAFISTVVGGAVTVASSSHLDTTMANLFMNQLRAPFAGK